MKDDMIERVLLPVPMERVLAAPVEQFTAALVPSLPPTPPRYRVPQEEWDAAIAARLAKQPETMTWEFFEVVEEPNAATCKHGQTHCARCGISPGDVAHTTIGGRGSVARALGRKGGR